MHEWKTETKMNAWIKEWNIDEGMNERMKHQWMHE